MKILLMVLMMNIGMILGRMNLGNEIDRAEMMINNGSIGDADNIYKELVGLFNDSEVFQDKHVEFMMSRGDYWGIINKYGNNTRMSEKIKKAKEHIGILESKNVRMIGELINVSPYCKDVIRSYIQVCLIDDKVDEAEKWIRKGLRLFPDGHELRCQEMQLYFARGMISSGIIRLEELGDLSSANDIRRVIEAYERIKNGDTSITYKYSRYSEILHKITMLEVSSRYSPSIFSRFKYEVMYLMCKSGVESGIRGLSGRAESLYLKGKNDDRMYIYCRSLILDGKIKEAERKCEEHKFIDIRLKDHILRYIDMKKKEDEERRRKKEEANERRKREEEERRRYSSRGGNKEWDWLGYYRILGFKESDNPDEKTIKKAYRKIIAVNNGKQQNEKEKNEWEGRFKKINKAYGVLTDKKKKEKYDKRVDPDGRDDVPQYDSLEDMFRRFGEFKAFDFSGGGGRGYSRGRTTYFYL